MNSTSNLWASIKAQCQKLLWLKSLWQLFLGIMVVADLSLLLLLGGVVLGSFSGDLPWSKPMQFTNTKVRADTDCSHARCLEGYEPLIQQQALKREEISKIELAQVLRVDDLLTKRHQYPGTVWSEQVTGTESVTKTRYRFDNALIGSYSGMLVESKQATIDKLPLLIVLPGHFESGAFAYKQRFNSSLANLGLRVFYVDFRGMDLDKTEAMLMKKLIHSGFTLMGLRLLEATLVLDYFLAQPTIQTDKVFVMGHSGGGELAVYLGILDTRVKYIITDNQPYSFKRMATSYSFHDEFIPDYYRILPENIKSLTDELELMVQPYGYKEEQPVLDWISEKLL